MAADPLEPVSIDAVFQNLRDRLEAFEAAFRQGPVGAQQVVDLWEKSLELKIESEEFYQFLLNYRTRLQDGGSSESNLLEADSPKRQPKMMLVVAEEVFSSRENEPLSITDLIEEMKARGVHFTAKDPAKSLAQAMKNSGRFETARRGMYRLKKL